MRRPIYPAREAFATRASASEVGMDEHASTALDRPRFTQDMIAQRGAPVAPAPIVPPPAGRAPCARRSLLACGAVLGIAVALGAVWLSFVGA